MQISSVQFRERCFKILEEVEKIHKEVVITKRGKPVAKLVHIEDEEKKDVSQGQTCHKIPQEEQECNRPMDWLA